MGKRIVIALGGNALGNTPYEQLALVTETAKPIVDLIAQGNEVIIAHGNGPQVGMINLGMATAAEAGAIKSDMPFPECGAMSQGYIGYHLQNAIGNELAARGLQKDVATVVTQVLVDENDPAFQKPTKPVGAFYDKATAERIAAEKGYTMVEDAGRGYRQVVPSPKPFDIVEAESIKALFNAGHVVIAVGGGAIMDLCKLLGCKRPDSVHELYYKRFPVVHEKDVIAIPTTCGTGSECTNISVAIVKTEIDGQLTGGETKLGLVSDDIIPNKVCLIPELIKTLPYKPFACSAIDALVHATESFLSPHRKTITSEMFSVKAMDMILKGFKLIDEKGQDARFEYLDEFVTASFFAGIAFLKAGCGPVHGMSFPLGGTYHVPHGESNYMLFGAILRYYDRNDPNGEIMKFKRLVADITGCQAENAIGYLCDLLQRILPLRPLRDCGFTEADFKAFPLSVEANQQRLMTNAYYPFDLAAEEAIYRECY